MTKEKTERELNILLCGTGNFGARIAFDIVASATVPTRLHIAGRNRERLRWLELASGGRATVFNRPVRIITHVCDLHRSEDLDSLINAAHPDVIVQMASAQAVSVLRDQSDDWSAVIRDGGYGASIAFQAIITARVAEALKSSNRPTHLVNCCFPDAVNAILKARNLPITCGVGNIAILSNILQGTLPLEQRAQFRMLAHYRNLHDWRCAPEERRERPARIWLNDSEIEDVYVHFPVRLSKEPVPDVSGASAAPPVLALASGGSWRGHLPGPMGLPGGYPVSIADNTLSLDLPSGVSSEQAVEFNSRFERENGVHVTDDGHVRYTGRLFDTISRHSPFLAQGFHVDDIEQAYLDMSVLRDRLQ